MSTPKTKAKPRFKGRTASFSVVIPTTDYEALAAAPGELTWRQLAQKAIREFAATLPQSEMQGAQALTKSV